MGSEIGRKRPRSSSDENRADCPFSVETVMKPQRDTTKDSKKRKGTPTGEKNPTIQISPFAPTGKFKTHETMDLHYKVGPHRQWQDMTRYNSFVLNGTKYYSEGFVFVANEDTVEQQKSGKAMATSTPDDFWVARILEIRAQDEHHVYARVYWMYKPDELPPHTLNGKKVAGGRQPYHGANELIASNHMDVINVVSVSMPAEVNHWIEADDEENQNELYWRQAFDIRTSELSTAHLLCSCKEPANPDKTLIGCTNNDCGVWMHHECLYDAVLGKVYGRLGISTPHIEKEDTKPTKTEDDGSSIRDIAAAQQEPMSPLETPALQTEATIDVVGAENRRIEVDASTTLKVEEPSLMRLTMPDGTVSQPLYTASSADVELKDAIDARAQTAKLPIKKRGKKQAAASEKPYLGLFEAKLRMNQVPIVWEITDLRSNVQGGVKVWTEPANCLVCNNTIE